MRGITQAPFFCERKAFGFKENNKGITPVVAVILLLLITISVAGFAAIFMQRLTQGAAESGEAQLNQQLSSIGSFDVINIDRNKVYIQNTGAGTLSGLSFYADGSVVQNVTPASIPQGAAAEITLNASQLAMVPGDKLRVTSAGYQQEKDGNFYSKNTVAYWRFDDTDGRTIPDSSGNGNDGLFSGETWNDGTINGATQTAGKYGNAMQFDGIDDYVSAGNTTTFKWLHGASDPTGFQFTMSFWVAIDNLNRTTNDLIYTGSGGVAGTGVEIWYNNEAVSYGLRTIYARILRGGVGALVATRAPDYSYPNDNGWHLITWTYDQALAENNSKLYIDGELAAQSNKTGQTPSTGSSSSPLQFGKLLTYTTNILSGKMDDVRIYNRALTQQEIQEDMNSAHPTSRTAASYSFESGAKDTHNVVKGRYGTAIAFDGTNDFVNAGNATSLNITGAMTIEAWVKTSTSGRGIVSKSSGVGTQLAYELSIEGFPVGDVGKVTFSRYAGGYGTAMSSTKVNDGNWHHVAAVDNLTSRNVYVDGTLRNTTASSSSPVTNSAVVKIGIGYIEDNYFNGIIDEVRILNTAV